MQKMEPGKTAWARRDSNTRSSPCEGLNLEIEPNALSLNELQLQYSHKELEQYLKAKTTQLSEKSVLWFNKASTILWDTTQGIISKDTMNAIREYTLSNYKCHDSWGKIFGFVKSFLTHLTPKPNPRARNKPRQALRISPRRPIWRL